MSNVCNCKSTGDSCNRCKPVNPHDVSASGSNELLCDCKGCPVKGSVCGYIAVGGKLCRAPDDYDCYYKNVDGINKAVSNIDNILNDSSDPELQKEMKEIFNT